MSDLKCCVECGRWGTWLFVPASNGRDGYQCSNDRACANRKSLPEPRVASTEDQ